MPIPSLRGESAGSVGESGPSLLHGTPVPQGGWEIRQGEHGFPSVLRTPLCPPLGLNSSTSQLLGAVGLRAGEAGVLSAQRDRRSRQTGRGDTLAGLRVCPRWPAALDPWTSRRCSSNYFRSSRGRVAIDRRTRVRFQFRASRSFLRGIAAAFIITSVPTCVFLSKLLILSLPQCSHL